MEDSLVQAKLTGVLAFAAAAFALESLATHGQSGPANYARVTEVVNVQLRSDVNEPQVRNLSSWRSAEDHGLNMETRIHESLTHLLAGPLRQHAITQQHVSNLSERCSTSWSRVPNATVSARCGTKIIFFVVKTNTHAQQGIGTDR